MSPEEKIEMGRKLIAEAEAEIAAKKRSWPEKIEPGMVFQHRGGGVYLWPDERCENLVCLVAGGKSRCGDVFYKDLARCRMDSFTYLGHARDLIKIADDAHEPTGAELVGKRVKYYDLNGVILGEAICVGYDAESRLACPYKVAGGIGWVVDARLAR